MDAGRFGAARSHLEAASFRLCAIQSAEVLVRTLGEEDRAGLRERVKRPPERGVVIGSGPAVVQHGISTLLG